MNMRMRTPQQFPEPVPPGVGMPASPGLDGLSLDQLGGGQPYPNTEPPVVEPPPGTPAMPGSMGMGMGMGMQSPAGPGSGPNMPFGGGGGGGDEELRNYIEMMNPPTPAPSFTNVKGIGAGGMGDGWPDDRRRRVRQVT